MRTLKALLTIVLVASLCSVQAQSIQEDLRKMNLAYVNSSSYAMDVEVETLKPESDQAFSTQKAYVRSTKDKLASSFNGITTIINDQHYVMINDHNQVIVVNNVTQEAKDAMKGLDVEAVIDSLTGLNAQNMKYIKRTPSVIVIASELDNPHYTRVKFVLDAKTHLLKRLTYYLKDESLPYDRIHIRYRNVKLGESISKSVFSAKKYVKISSKSITPTTDYRDYKIVDQRRIKPM